ncbi:BolA family transcriptional regulator [Rickettsia endosymbiont of Gonocerus acuteangulatus]|uniref:BolA family protein n=1 Tax=Rickettsia endosymbiont of Gonocerus acuteangulatus TaxID=3066266 RepID=UPI003132D97A
MSRIDRITKSLSVLKPHFCEIIDESHKHASHYDGIQSHIKIKISAEILQGKSLVANHRTINSLLADEFQNGLHALSIEVL